MQLAIIFTFPLLSLTIAIDDQSPNCDFYNGNMCGYQFEWAVGLKWQLSHDSPGHPRGTSAGYLYTLLVSNQQQNRYAAFVSPEFESTQEQCLYFEWQNDICTDYSNPALEVFLRKNGKDTLLQSFSCTHGRKWSTAEIPLPRGKYRLAFSSQQQRVQNYQKRVAVDDIRIRNGTCGLTVTSYLPGDCSFEALSACKYKHSHKSNFNWNVVNGVVIPEYGQVKTKYLKVGSESYGKLGFTAAIGKKAIIHSPAIQFTGSSCVRVSYINTAKERALRVHLVNSQSGHHRRLSKLKKTLGWRTISMPITNTNGSYSLQFVARLSAEFTEVGSYVAIDNVEYFNSDCSQVNNLPTACTAETVDDVLCYNGGTCFGFGKKIYKCSCPSGFYGDICQHAIPCATQPCQNGGACTNLGHSSFVCTCKQANTGRLCDNDRSCGEPGILVPNSRVINVTSTTIGGVAHLQCNHGYRPSGSTFAKCKSNGIWQAGMRCAVINCGNPWRPGGSRLVFLSNTLQGGEVQFQCVKDYTMAVGDGKFRCGSLQLWVNDNNETLNQQSIKCERDCGSLENIHDEDTYSITNTTVGGIATFTCPGGHKMVGDGELICNTNGKWQTTVNCKHRNSKCGLHNTIVQVSGRSQLCVPLYCHSTLMATNNVSVVVYNDSTYGDEMDYICNSGFRLNEFVTSARFRCEGYPVYATYASIPTLNYTAWWMPLNEGWSMWKQEIRCEPIPTCGTVENIENGEIVSVSNTSVNGLVMYTCLSGYKLNGQKYAKCIEYMYITYKRGQRQRKYIKKAYWAFVPKCLKYCSVENVQPNETKTGGYRKVRVEINKCKGHDFTRFSENDTCTYTISFDVEKDDFRDGDYMKFDGNFLCISYVYTETYTHQHRSQGRKNDIYKHCKSFCMTYQDFVRIDTSVKYDYIRAKVERAGFTYRTVPISF